LWIVLAWAATGVAAAEVWIASIPGSPQPSEDIRVVVMEGSPFDESARPLTVREGRFQRVWKRGRQDLSVRDDGRQASEFTPQRPGVQLVAFSNLRATGGTDYCKALIVVGDASPSDPIHLSEMGHRLEIVPQTDPVTLLRRGGTLQVQLLLDREPLAGTTVRAIPAADPDGGVQSAPTDEIGLADLRLDGPGRWMIHVDHHDLSSTLIVVAGPER
jgi:hypothetical protein